jgi:hypothetical protein
MPRKKPAVPWPEDQYYIDEEEKVIWLMGSFMRSMMLRDRRTTVVPGYEIKLATYKGIQGIKNDAKQE